MNVILKFFKSFKGHFLAITVALNAGASWVVSLGNVLLKYETTLCRCRNKGSEVAF